MNKLDIAKQIIRENYKNANCGIFNTRNVVGDPMITIYEGDGLTIDICYHYSYFEVFGLSNDEFKKLKNFYYTLDEKENELC